MELKTLEKHSIKQSQFVADLIESPSKSSVKKTQVFCEIQNLPG
jgi:hypothetical protein